MPLIPLVMFVPLIDVPVSDVTRLTRNIFSHFYFQYKVLFFDLTSNQEWRPCLASKSNAKRLKNASFKTINSDSHRSIHFQENISDVNFCTNQKLHFFCHLSVQVIAEGIPMSWCTNRRQITSISSMRNC